MQHVRIPLDLPIIDITAEHTWVDTPDELTAMRRAHSEFVAASPKCEGIFAKGSGHYIFKDQPNVVTDAKIEWFSKPVNRNRPASVRLIAVALAPETTFAGRFLKSGCSVRQTSSVRDRAGQEIAWVVSSFSGAWAFWAASSTHQ